MNLPLKNKLIQIAKGQYKSDDPSHDFSHIERVLLNAENIAGNEKEADLDIIIAATLFHDLVNYPKNDPRNKYSTDESAEEAEKLLLTISDYPKDKISAVKECIKRTSFSKGLKAETIEQMVLQDSDMLEATGAISIMRTFTSGGKMNRALYNTNDPFLKNRAPEEFGYSLDLFYTRLMKVKDRMNTKKGKIIAIKRTKFLKNFLKELVEELRGE